MTTCWSAWRTWGTAATSSCRSAIEQRRIQDSFRTVCSLQEDDSDTSPAKKKTKSGLTMNDMGGAKKVTFSLKIE